MKLLKEFTWTELGVGAAVVAIFLTLTIGDAFYCFGTVDSATVTVNRAERVVSGNGKSVDSYYLLFTDQGVFRNSDNLLWGKFNSSDIQGMATDGARLHLRYYGWRVPFLSLYPNVIEAKQR